MRDIMVRDQAALNLLMRENFRSRTWQPPPDPEGGSPVRPVYTAWNDKLKIARLPLRYFANGHTFFVQRMCAHARARPSDARRRARTPTHTLSDDEPVEAVSDRKD